MRFLLDTNVISEWVKPHPDPNVVSWLAEADEDRVFISVASLAEIRFGIDLMPGGRRQDRLILWLEEELPVRFEGRVLAIDRRIADTWGIVSARARKTGGTLGSMDAFFAATAETHALTLVTRNTGDFEKLKIPLLNPWHAPV
ncbi:MAG: type II toxin-antitoxin system VapC family toxin [Bryobacteraceae bacterium]